MPMPAAPAQSATPVRSRKSSTMVPRWAAIGSVTYTKPRLARSAWLVGTAPRLATQLSTASRQSAASACAERNMSVSDFRKQLLDVGQDVGDDEIDAFG